MSYEIKGLGALYGTEIFRGTVHVVPSMTSVYLNYRNESKKLEEWAGRKGITATLGKYKNFNKLDIPKISVGEGIEVYVAMRNDNGKFQFVGYEIV